MPVQRGVGGHCADEALDSRGADATALLLTVRRCDTFLGQSERRSVKKSKSSPNEIIKITITNQSTLK
jgi:hypothetical protein